MPTGKIKYYNQDKGYGFIAQDEGEDLFFHILKSPSVGEIKAGQRVKYEITRGKKGLEGENIQLILTPFEKRKLEQGRVVVSRDTLVWTPDTDVRSGARQPEQRPSAQRKRPAPQHATSKPSPKEVKKSPPQVEKTQAPKKSQQLSKKKAAPSQQPTVKASPTEKEKKIPEKIKPEGKPQESVSQEVQQEITPAKASKKKQQKRKLTYCDRYMLKQIRENTPMVFEMYNHESIFCTVTKLLKYDLELLVDDGEKIQIQKHNIKYCYKQENKDKVKAHISFDESVRSQGLMPIVPRKERYQIDQNMVKKAWEEKQKVRLVTREGEIIVGLLAWFSIYEIKVNLPPGGNVIAFFHAVYDFKVLSEEEAKLKEQKLNPATAVVEKQVEHPVEDGEEVPDVEQREQVVTPSPVEEEISEAQAVEVSTILSSTEIPLGEKIRIARKDLRMSQKALADLFGVSTQTIGNWERGKSQPQAKYQEQIEQFFATAQS